MGRGVAGIALGTVVLALAACGGSGGISLPCSAQAQGRLCIKVFHDGSTVQDVIAYRASSGSELAGQTWRLVVTAAGRTYPGPTVHGNPPLATFCRTGNGATTTTPSGCHDTLAAAYASHGDFARLRLPRTMPSGTDFCVSEEVLNGGAWLTQTPPNTVCASG